MVTIDFTARRFARRFCNVSISALLINDSEAIFDSCIMLNPAPTGLFPTLAEVGRMTEAHVFQGLCEEAQGNLDNSTLLHLLFAVPLICEQGVHDLIPLFLQGRDSFLPGCDDFFIGFSSHRLGQHSFHVLHLRLHQGVTLQLVLVAGDVDQGIFLSHVDIHGLAVHHMNLLQAAYSVVHQAIAVDGVGGLPCRGRHELLLSDDIAVGVQGKARLRLPQRLIRLGQGHFASGVLVQNFVGSHK
nr:MAG TPA: hypothetical protein [Caudoviricetes sp.]